MIDKTSWSEGKIKGDVYQIIVKKKDWTKKKIKEITEVVQTMTEEEFDALPESLSETLKYLRKYG